MIKLSSKAFSLVELMIVVAIIGMLAAVGIPQYAKFQAKARQSEAKSSLSSLFSAEKSFYGEWGFYTFDLKNVGYGVEGKKLRYLTGFGGVAATIPCATGGTYNGPPEILLGTTNSWSNGTNVNSATATWHNLSTFSNIAAADPDVAAQVLVTTAKCHQNDFTAIAIGDVRNSPADIDLTAAVHPANSDLWSMDEQRNLKMLRQGF